MNWLRPCSKASSRSPAWLRSRCSHSDATSGLGLCFAGPRLLGPPGAAPQRAPGGAARPLHHSGGRQASSTQGSPACRPRLRAPPGDMVYANTLTRLRPKLIHVYMRAAQRQSLVWLWRLRPQVATQSVPCGAPHQPQRLAWDFGSGPQAPLRRGQAQGRCRAGAGQVHGQAQSLNRPFVRGPQVSAVVCRCSAAQSPLLLNLT